MMNEEEKISLIKLLFKKMGEEDAFNKNIDIFSKMFYGIKDIDIIEKVKKDFNFNKYCERIVPLFDEEFSIEEIRHLMAFFSSKAGKKIVEGNHLKKVAKEADSFFSEMGIRLNEEGKNESKI